MRRILRTVAAFFIVLTLAFNACGVSSPACAAGANSTVYTFGDPNGPFPDLAKEHKEEVKRLEKERKKAEKEKARQERAAKKKAAKAAREREKKEKAAKKGVKE